MAPRLFYFMTVLLLDAAMQVVEARVHGLSIGRERPARNLHHLAVTQVRFLDCPFVDQLEGNAVELVTTLVGRGRAVEFRRKGSAHSVNHRECAAAYFEGRVFDVI